MESRTCGTCKYRGKEIETEDGETFEMKGTGYFTCERIKHDEDWKYRQGKMALVVDGSGYYAALCVESDFGCSAWEVANVEVTGLARLFAQGPC